MNSGAAVHTYCVCAARRPLPARATATTVRAIEQANPASAGLFSGSPFSLLVVAETYIEPRLDNNIHAQGVQTFPLAILTLPRAGRFTAEGWQTKECDGFQKMGGHDLRIPLP